jgi:hypothetical protein
MRLLKRLIELAFFVALLLLFSKNMGVVIPINFYRLTEPIQLKFYELVIFCVSLGIIIAALGDALTQIQWVRERRRMKKVAEEHGRQVETLRQKINALEEENEKLQRNWESRHEQPAGVSVSKAGQAAGRTEAHTEVAGSAHTDQIVPGPEEPPDESGPADQTQRAASDEVKQHTDGVDEERDAGEFPATRVAGAADETGEDSQDLSTEALPQTDETESAEAKSDEAEAAAGEETNVSGAPPEGPEKKKSRFSLPFTRKSSDSP